MFSYYSAILETKSNVLALIYLYNAVAVQHADHMEGTYIAIILSPVHMSNSIKTVRVMFSLENNPPCRTPTW